MWKEGLADVIELRSYWLRVGRDLMTGTLIRGRFDTETGHGIREAETGVTQLSAKKHQALLASSRS